MKKTFILAHPQARKLAQEHIQSAPDGFMVTVSEPKKRRIQEERYHAMIGEIAKQCDYHGRKLGQESWKRLLVEAMVFILREEAKGQGKPVGCKNLSGKSVCVSKKMDSGQSFTGRCTS